MVGGVKKAGGGGRGKGVRDDVREGTRGMEVGKVKLKDTHTKDEAKEEVEVVATVIPVSRKPRKAKVGFPLRRARLL